MKRIFCIFSLMACWTVNYVFAELNSAQLKLFNDINQFLLEEGYKPDADVEEGEIIFYKDDVKYRVLVDDRDTSPLYLSLRVSYKYGETYTREDVINNFEEVNIRKAVKLVVFDTSYSFQAEMYVINSKNFIDTFDKLMGQIEDADEALHDVIKKSKSKYSKYADNTVY